MNSKKDAWPSKALSGSMFGIKTRKDHFSFAQGYRPLNHGSFGASPRAVADYQRQLQLEIEARPDIFIRYTYPKLLQAARSAIAPLLGADVDEVVFIPNATTGINTVLRNIDFEEGDVVIHFNTIYGACLKTLQSVAEGAGITLCAVNLTYPVEDNEVLDKFENMVSSVQASGKTVRMAMFDTVLTFPGVRFPWEALVRSCRKFGILSFIDGAHGIGHVDLTHLGSLKPDFVISNCYKLVKARSPHSISSVPLTIYLDGSWCHEVVLFFTFPLQISISYGPRSPLPGDTRSPERGSR